MAGSGRDGPLTNRLQPLPTFICLFHQLLSFTSFRFPFPMKSFHIFLIAILLPAAASEAQLRVGGSDLLTPHLETALAEFSETQGVDLEVELTGSYHGLERLRQGEFDISIVAIPDGGEVPGGEFQSIKIASKIVTVAVAPSNPINQITLRQLAGIFAGGEAGAADRWGQLGLTGEWSGRAIAPGAITPMRHSLTLDLFRHAALGGRGLRRSLTYFEDTAAIRRRFEQDNSGIILLHRVPEDTDGLKILSIAATDDGIARQPTPETVAADEYPLRLPLYLVFPADTGSDLRDLLRYLVSEEATEAIEASALVPLPAAQRQRMAFEFERL